MSQQPSQSSDYQQKYDDTGVSNKFQNNNKTKFNSANNQFACNSSRVNKMPDEQLVGTLKYHNLNAKGSPEVLRKRLKEFMKRQMSKTDDNCNVENLYSYFLIIDFEATCDETNGLLFQHEIIEFPIILYDVVLHKKVDVFHAYCRPNINPALSVFCKSLTNIHQNTVDQSKPFADVLFEVEQWLNKHHMFSKSFAVVCDCNADMAKFMRIQCEISSLDFPSWCKQWINITKSFRQFYKVNGDIRLNMHKMLSSLGLEFEGRQHSGLNDAENILRITETMINDGCSLRINEKLDSFPPYFTASVSRKEAEMLSSQSYLWNSQNLINSSSNDSSNTTTNYNPYEYSSTSNSNNSNNNTTLPQLADSDDNIL